METHSTLMADARKNPLRPIVGVGAVVFKSDKVLLIKRGKPPKESQWSLPGGAQELGETVTEALHREVLEETGLTVVLGALIDVLDFIEQDKDTTQFHYTLIDYAAEYVSGELKPASDAVDAHFFSLEEALALPLWSETKRVIETAAHQRGIL